MADDSTVAVVSARPPLNDPAPLDFVRSLGRQLPRTAAPEGWVKRIDRRRVALKDREKGEARIGRTKAKESDSSVPVPPDLSREIAAWIAAHPERTNPRAFLFPNRRETPYSVGNYFKRYLKPLAERVGIHDLNEELARPACSPC